MTEEFTRITFYFYNNENLLCFYTIYVYFRGKYIKIIYSGNLKPKSSII